MQYEQILHILSSVKVPLNHPLFFSRVFALAVKNRQSKEAEQPYTIQSIIAEEYEELSRHLDRSQIQESCSVRNILRVRHLVCLLIDDKGELNMALLLDAIKSLKAHLYSLGPNRQYDAKRQEHILKILEVLHQDKNLIRFLKKITKPLSNKNAEDIIRDTLQLPSNTLITDAYTKRAVLAAWLSYLRQNVGSCFATAPAKIIHDEQPELFLQDIADLVAIGRLKRTFGGIEYSVPLSASWGGGDLKKPLLIQCSSKHIHPEIWYSPGLIVAFESIGLLKNRESTKQKISQLKNWIIPLIQQKRNLFPYFVMTAEEIIRAILLQASGLTEQNLRDYENRPKSMIHNQVFMQLASSSRSLGGIGEKCIKFLEQFEIAKNAFKGLADNALLKSWEFTLASFSETKLEFTHWNLYSSLGMKTDEPGGIGQCIYHMIQRKLDVVNKKVQELHYEYEIAYTQIKILETRIRQVSTEKEIQWLKVEYQNQANEFYFLQEQYNEAQYQARTLVGLYESLYRLYLGLFKDYFQEVYDADMQEVTTGPFDDSPAGFRLVYKHGRDNPSLWTRIHNQTEFIDALTSFFVATEPQIAATLEIKEMERDLSEIVTAIIHHIKTKDFLESAFHRMAAAHHAPLIKDPLEHLDQIEKKPWVYTSGGTMNTLISCYYRLENKPKEDSKWVESSLELLVFLVDTIKLMPHYLLEPYLKETHVAMLMQSPTHAFLLKPALPLFKESWMNEEFTYTFVRDHIARPAERFVENLLLDNQMIEFFIEFLSEKVPENFRPRFKAVLSQITGPINSISFREYIIDMVLQDRGLRYGRTSVLAADEVDSILYTHLPLCPLHELRDRLRQLFILLPGIHPKHTEEMLVLFDQIPLSRSSQMVSANHLQDICKALLCLMDFAPSTAYDYHLAVSQAAQKLGFAMPTPLLFADTNWAKDEFGFVLNPGTGKFELWRLDYTGRVGYPMSSWSHWLDGSHVNPQWSIYTKPMEYGQN